MPYKNQNDKTEHMRDYRTLKQNKRKRINGDRLYKKMSRIAEKFGVDTEQIFFYRSFVRPKAAVIKLAAELPKSPHTKLFNSHWLWILAYIAKQAFDGQVLRHPGPQIFGACSGKAHDGGEIPLLHLLYRIGPVDSKNKADIRIHVLMVETQEGLTRDLIRQRLADLLNKEWPLPPFALLAAKDKSPHLAEFLDFLDKAATHNILDKLPDANRDRWHQLRVIEADLRGIEQDVIVRANEFAVWQALLQLGEHGVQHPDRRVAGISLPVPGWNI